jgi:hypothetical protein
MRLMAQLTVETALARGCRLPPAFLSVSGGFMTTLKWDHAVQFVNQPDEAIATFAGQGLNAFAGGRHPGWGTWNALSYLGLPISSFSPLRLC